MANVDPATRYSAAGGELCARIFVRNNTLLHFTAFSSGILAFAIRGGSDISIIGVSIPYLSLFVVLISSYHERTMYKLMEYQSKLAALDGNSVPNWYSEEYFGSLGQTRLMRDWAQIYIILPISLGALALIYSRWESYALEYRTSYLCAVIMACISLVVAMSMLLYSLYKKITVQKLIARNFPDSQLGPVKKSNK